MNTQFSASVKQAAAFGAVVRLWTELKSNRRAASGLVAVFAVMAIYGLLRLDDAVDSMRSAYRQQVALIQRTIATSEEKNWPARAKQSTDIRQAMEQRLWGFESEGVALANLQDWVTAAGRDAGLTKLQVRIDVARPKELPSDARQLTATITAAQTEPAMTSFLDKIQRDPHLFVIDTLHVQQRPTPLLQMTLSTYVKLATASGAAAK